MASCGRKKQIPAAFVFHRSRNGDCCIPSHSILPLLRTCHDRVSLGEIQQGIPHGLIVLPGLQHPAPWILLSWSRFPRLHLRDSAAIVLARRGPWAIRKQRRADNEIAGHSFLGLFVRLLATQCSQLSLVRCPVAFLRSYLRECLACPQQDVAYEFLRGVIADCRTAFFELRRFGPLLALRAGAHCSNSFTHSGPGSKIAAVDIETHSLDLCDRRLDDTNRLTNPANAKLWRITIDLCLEQEHCPLMSCSHEPAFGKRLPPKVLSTKMARPCLAHTASCTAGLSPR